MTIQRVWLAVAAGGGLGTLARILATPGILTGQEPQWGLTLAVNLVGAGVFGIVAGHGLPGATEAMRQAITTGFLGSFTTFSAIAAAWLSLTVSGDGFLGAAYFIGTFAGGVACAFVGLRVGHKWRGRNEKAVTDDA